MLQRIGYFPHIIKSNNLEKSVYTRVVLVSLPIACAWFNMVVKPIYENVAKRIVGTRRPQRLVTGLYLLVGCVQLVAEAVGVGFEPVFVLAKVLLEGYVAFKIIGVRVSRRVRLLGLFLI